MHVDGKTIQLANRSDEPTSFAQRVTTLPASRPGRKLEVDRTSGLRMCVVEGIEGQEGNAQNIREPLIGGDGGPHRQPAGALLGGLHVESVGVDDMGQVHCAAHRLHHFRPRVEAPQEAVQPCPLPSRHQIRFLR